MLPEAGATELIFLAAVALIVVGPKDLPVLMRKVGQWVAKMRGLAAEFRSSFDELARQSELDELRKEVEALRNTTRLPDPVAELNSTFHDIDPGLDPSGYAMPVDPHGEMTSLPAAHLQTATVEEIAPAKPARAPRKPKAGAAEPKAKPAAKPRAKARPAAAADTTPPTPKPRARRAATPAEPQG